MIKWFKSLSRQEKFMALLIVLLVIGVILRWDTIRKRALVWFKYDDIMEERALQDSLNALREECRADSVDSEIRSAIVIDDTIK